MVCASAAELNAALSEASRGETVRLSSDIAVSKTIRVPRDVTLASGRGEGRATLSVDDESTVVELQRGARLTGVEVAGPHHRYRDWDDYPCGTGVDVVGAGVGIDNCEIHGFAYTGVHAREDTWVHRCNVHHNPQNGLGYGVMVATGHARITDCRFDYNRHSVAAPEGSSGYTIENCRFGPETIHHVVDHHGPSKDARIVIRGCTFEPTHKISDDAFYDAGAETEAIRLRGGGTAGETVVEDCWFHHPEAPAPTGGKGEALYLGSGGSWSEKNATLRGNHFGESAPADGVGCTR